MSEKTVKIETQDPELYEMLALWLSDDGYKIADSDTADIVITDMDAAVPKIWEFAKVLYITDQKTSDDAIERPFSRLDFLTFVRGNASDEISVRVDHKRRRVYNKKAYITLTDKEYAVFRMLYDRTGEAIPREEISVIARGGEQKTNAADVYICMLRRKLTELFGYSPIKTVRGHGYALSLDKRK